MFRPQYLIVPLGLCAISLAHSLLAGFCADDKATPIPELKLPFLASPVTIDGKLDEACYRNAPLVERFVVAGEPRRKPQDTKAWLFWNQEKLVFAFACKDTDIVAKPESGHEHDVDDQDRVELFVWSGREADPYYCIEIGARGAVHDYKARFYRKFDDAWSPKGWKHAVAETADGFSVEAELSKDALQEMGLALKTGTSLRAGLFRADFSTGKPKDPTWITWVDARTKEPDFHVAVAFGSLTLLAPK